MPNKKKNSKVILSTLVILVLGLAAVWIIIARQNPALDTKTGKKFIANFEKICRTTRSSEACKKIAGKGHTKCLLASASKDESGGVVYSKQTYLSCLEK